MGIKDDFGAYITSKKRFLHFLMNVCTQHDLEVQSDVAPHLQISAVDYATRGDVKAWAEFRQF